MTLEEETKKHLTILKNEYFKFTFNWAKAVEGYRENKPTLAIIGLASSGKTNISTVVSLARKYRITKTR
jgi:hypothetical protein